jgi:hypothetical protein
VGELRRHLDSLVCRLRNARAAPIVA